MNMNAINAKTFAKALAAATEGRHLSVKPVFSKGQKRLNCIKVNAGDREIEIYVPSLRTVLAQRGALEFATLVNAGRASGRYSFKMDGDAVRTISEKMAKEQVVVKVAHKDVALFGEVAHTGKGVLTGAITTDGDDSDDDSDGPDAGAPGGVTAYAEPGTVALGMILAAGVTVAAIVAVVVVVAILSQTGGTLDLEVETDIADVDLVVEVDGQIDMQAEIEIMVEEEESTSDVQEDDATAAEAEGDDEAEADGEATDK
mmetsp:Transcript_29107/g.56039  ORF Transcript_29107/g.56039 Transcript_29107/m.56039 type:complete len:258 (-) Transcript_29107:661-1434(-)